jgi:chemotaxis protein MotB
VKDDQAPVRKVIIRRGHGGGHHGGAWKVAYADFVTTMMALFIVLWIVGQGASVREAIAKYFRDPGVFRQGGKTSLAPGGEGVLPEDHATGEATPVSASEREERDLREAAKEMRRLLEQTALASQMREQVTIDVVSEGLRIELTERETGPFFKVGSSFVLDAMRSILTALVPALERLPNHITVEGHTDSRQYSASRTYSNWELSADRANAARRVLEGAGLAPGRVDRIVGYADRLPIVRDAPLDARNRRIAVLVRREAVAASAERAGGEPGTSPAPQTGRAPERATATPGNHGKPGDR